MKPLFQLLSGTRFVFPIISSKNIVSYDRIVQGFEGDFGCPYITLENHYF